MSSIIRISILFLMACAWNVEGKAFMKQRLSLLESRVNSIEQDIVTVNASFVNREDHVCECSNAKADIDAPIKQNFGQSVVTSKQSETRIKKGLMDEKKWVRQKVKHVENEMHKVVNQVLEDNKNTNAKTVRKMQNQENDMDRKLNVAIAKVTKNCSDKIANQEENNENSTEEIMTKIQTIENEQDRKLNLAITEVIANYSDEIRKRDVKIDDLQAEIDNLKQVIQFNINLNCPDGWKEFQSFCYLYVKEQKKYDSARETCLKLGASVADIQSSSENDFVYKFCEDNGHTWNGSIRGILWIGFSDEETESVWISDRTKETSAYMNWRPGQPDVSSQHCIIMGTSAPYEQWNDYRCASTYKFVCKKKLPYM